MEYHGATGKKIDAVDTVKKHVSEALTGVCVDKLSQVDKVLEDLRESGE